MTEPDESRTPFSLSVTFEGPWIVLGVRGEVNLYRSPRFHAVLDSVIDQGNHLVVVDLEDLDFIDASGLQVIGEGADRLRRSGGQLIVRSPSTRVDRLFDITGMALLVRLERAVPNDPALGAGPKSTVRLKRQQPALEATAVRGYVDIVNAALRIVVNLARATVGGADGVSVSLRREGRLSTVAASDRTISEMDASQYTTKEGPCVDASIQGRGFHAESLDSEERWPAFTPRARGAWRQCDPFITPPGQRASGRALNIYSRSAAPFAPEDQELAMVFASEASAILTDAELHGTDIQFASRLADAQRGRLTVALAQGIIMEREGIDEDQAYTLLRELSQRSNRPLREGAEEVVSSGTRSRSASQAQGEHHV